MFIYSKKELHALISQKNNTLIKKTIMSLEKIIDISKKYDIQFEFKSEKYEHNFVLRITPTYIFINVHLPCILKTYSQYKNTQDLLEDLVKDLIDLNEEAKNVLISFLKKRNKFKIVKL